MYSTGLNYDKSPCSGLASSSSKNFRLTRGQRMPTKKKTDDTTDATNTLIEAENNTKLVLNISGKRFEIYERLVKRYPESLLGDRDKLNNYYDKLKDEYFFDRNREAFEGILFFYQTNRFELPHFIAEDVFFYELKFFGLDNYLNNDSKCDDSILYTAIDEEYKELKKIVIDSENREDIKRRKIELKKRFSRIDYFFDEEEDEDEHKMPRNRLQRWLWVLLERPNKTYIGRLIAIICLITIICSVILICAESVYDSNVKTHKANQEFKLKHNASDIPGKNSTEFDYTFKFGDRRLEFFILEFIFNSIFTIEIFFRMLAAPVKSKFFTSFTNLIDILSIMPFWSSILVNNSHFFYWKLFGVEEYLASSKATSNQYGLSILRVLKLTRILRILKLSRHVRALNIMGRILKECLYEIVLLLTCLGINIIIFSSLIYYIESYSLGEMSPFLSKHLFLGYIL
jgi:potassium voltage-gated channel Shaker-related subfamily A protein 1